MKKVAIFTEGQSELIFVRNFLFRIIDNARLSFECLKLHRGREVPERYRYGGPSPDFFFLIINVEGDSKVISAIKERAAGLLGKGYVEIIGMRDMYCDEYDRRSGGAINEDVSRQFIDEHERTIQSMSNPDTITVFFSIMELEAWFLAMYNVFKKINPTLTVDYIERQLTYNLRNIDPQRKFYRPTNEIKKIWQLCGLNYRKSDDDAEKITRRMEISDFENAFENGRCESFKRFYQKMGLIAY